MFSKKRPSLPWLIIDEKNQARKVLFATAAVDLVVQLDL